MALDALKKVPVAKIKDTKLKQAIIRSYMQLLAERSKLQEQEDGIRALFLDQYQDEQKEVSKLFIELQNTEDGDKRKALSAEFEKYPVVFHKCCLSFSTNKSIQRLCYLQL